MIKNPFRLIILLAVIYVSSNFLLAQSGPKAPSELYNTTESRQYVYYAVLAYCPKKCLESWNCQSGKEFVNFGQVTYINNLLTVSSCYVGYQRAKNKIIVSFRGSSNIQNWLENFNFEKVSYPGCKGCEVHAGFFQDYRLIEEKIDAKVVELINKHPNATIVTTGHSSGAALSVIAGLRLKAKFGVKVEVHNYGCPRIGNSALAQFISTRVDIIFRIIHNKDLIPHIPPESFEYHHPPYEVFWNAEFTTYTICNDSGEDKQCSNKFSPDYTVGDHDFYFFDFRQIKC